MRFYISALTVQVGHQNNNIYRYRYGRSSFHPVFLGWDKVPSKDRGLGIPFKYDRKQGNPLGEVALTSRGFNYPNLWESPLNIFYIKKNMKETRGAVLVYSTI